MLHTRYSYLRLLFTLIVYAYVYMYVCIYSYTRKELFIIAKEMLRNYRHVSSFTSAPKILEKVVLKQLEEHLVSNEFLDLLLSI